MWTRVRTTTRLRRTDGTLIVNRRDTRPAGDNSIERGIAHAEEGHRPDEPRQQPVVADRFGGHGLLRSMREGQSTGTVERRRRDYRFAGAVRP